MTTTKVIELVGESTKGWEEAVENAVSEAHRTLEDITGVEVVNMTGNVCDGRITEFKVNVHVAFPVKEKR